MMLPLRTIFLTKTTNTKLKHILLDKVIIGYFYRTVKLVLYYLFSQVWLYLFANRVLSLFWTYKLLYIITINTIPIVFSQFKNKNANI